MIARDSKSFPFLAIAQHHKADYADVLRMAEAMKNGTTLAYGTLNDIGRMTLRVSSEIYAIVHNEKRT